MWAFCTRGMYSVVLSRRKNGKLDPKHLMVRARLREHLAALHKRYPELRQCEIIETPDADYGFRMIVPKKIWTDVMAALVIDIDYPNFKNACAHPDASATYLDCLHRVWAEAVRMQREGAQREG